MPGCNDTHFSSSDKMGDEDAEVACQAWTTKLPKAAQPNLNYMGRLELNLFSILS